MITSAMFLTGTTGNLVAMRLAADQGVTVSWGTWFLAALIPGIISLGVMPLIIFRLFPPSVRETPDATRIAREELARLGSVRVSEWIMLGVFGLLLVLWIFGAKLGGIEPTTAALIGLSLLLLLGELTWSDILNERGAWDTLVWFAALLTMASFLNRFGLIPWFSQSVAGLVGPLGWHTGFLALGLVYFYSHYFFASSTAHASAMYAPFLATALAIGTPTLFAALVLVFLNGLLGILTHYGGGPAPVFFGAGYVSVADWWRLGAMLSVVYLGIWGLIGGAWWKLLGIW
jgi:DASS family divalent anion:Na+ symporter